MSTDGTQLSMPELVRRIANLWDSRHANQMAKDSYGYGGYMKESTVKRFLHEEMNKSIQGSVGIRATPHIITGPLQPIPVTSFAPSRQFISYQQYPQVPKQPR
jgi:hypothetical protein